MNVNPLSTLGIVSSSRDLYKTLYSKVSSSNINLFQNQDINSIDIEVHAFVFEKKVLGCRSKATYATISEASSGVALAMRSISFPVKEPFFKSNTTSLLACVVQELEAGLEGYVNTDDLTTMKKTHNVFFHVKLTLHEDEEDISFDMQQGDLSKEDLAEVFFIIKERII